MYLGPNGARLFFRVWLPLLGFVNERYGVVPELSREDNPRKWTLSIVLPIRSRLWEDPSVISDYIQERGRDLSDQAVRILSGWQRPVKGDFIVVKHLKSYTVFMTNDRLYGVLGITNPLSDQLPPPPNYVEAVLLPFEGRIIYDSLIAPYDVQFGAGTRAEIREQYRSLKEHLGIQTSLYEQ